MEGFSKSVSGYPGEEDKTSTQDKTFPSNLNMTGKKSVISQEVQGLKLKGSDEAEEVKVEQISSSDELSGTNSNTEGSF